MNARTIPLLVLPCLFWACASPDESMPTGRDPGTSPTGPMDGGTVGADPDGGAAPDPGPGTDAGTTPEPVDPQPPGSSCSCDAECEGTDAHPGVCVRGICMQRASGVCSSSGSQAECPDGSRCWRVADTEEPVCWPDCDTYECDGTCDEDGSCVSPRDGTCDPFCGSFCGEIPCSPENPMGPCMGDDQVCLDGACVDACSPSNPDGYCPPDSECIDGSCVGDSPCPTWMCTGSSCTELVQLPGSTDPDSAEARADGYFIDTALKYAYIRRDLSMLIQYAACEVARRFPGTNPIGISDLSQADGRTPGLDVGRARHPTTTHRGSDMDLAYYQTDGLNDTQIVCGDGSDRNGNGSPGRYNDGYFCTTETNIVDWERQAYWFAMLATNPLVRVFGIDQTMPDDFREHLDLLLDRGWISDEQRRPTGASTRSSVTQVRVSPGDPLGVARDVRIQARIEGGRWIGASRSLRLDAASGERVEWYAELVGPGGAVLRRRGSREAPLSFVVAGGGAGPIAPRPEDDDGGGAWGWIVAGTVAAGVGVLLAILFAMGDDGNTAGGGGTSVTGPDIVDF